MLINTIKVSVTFPVRLAVLGALPARFVRSRIVLESNHQHKSACKHLVHPARTLNCAYATSVLDTISMPESVVQDLQPQALWNYFYALTQLPRPSKSEEKYVSLLATKRQAALTLQL